MKWKKHVKWIADSYIRYDASMRPATLEVERRGSTSYCWTVRMTDRFLASGFCTTKEDAKAAAEKYLLGWNWL